MTVRSVWNRTDIATLAVGLGIVSIAVGLSFSWAPSLWTDEVATHNAVTRSWEELFALLQNVDAVHAGYYVILKPWIDIVGASPFSLRLPSAIAVGVATAGVCVLANLLAGRATAIAAGLVMIVLPSMTAASIEARSGALVTALATWSAVFLVLAVRRSRRWWIAYAGAMVLMCLVFFLATVLLAAHLATLVWSARRRRALVPWFVSAAIVVVAVLPVALLASSQAAQVSWIETPTIAYVAGSFAAASWFGESILVGGVVWILIVVALWRKQTPSAWHGSPSLAASAVPWLLVPGLIVVVLSFVVTPVFVARYIIYSAPAAALLAGAAISSLAKYWRAGVSLALVAACLPVLLSQRGEFGKDLADWSAAARELAEISDSGDSVLFVSDAGSPRAPRRAAEAYPDSFANLEDPGLVATYTELDGLWDVGSELRDTVAELDPSTTTWALVSLVSVNGDRSRAEADFRSLGLEPELVWSGPSTLIYRLDVDESTSSR